MSWQQSTSDGTSRFPSLRPNPAAEAHELAEAALKGRGARVPRGCLLRRVPADLRTGRVDASFAPALERAGFRGDRLSVWGLQVGGRAGGRDSAQRGGALSRGAWQWGPWRDLW